jgi:hypothetical protein
MIAFLVPNASAILPWVISIGSSLYMLMDTPPAPKPDPYTDFGIVCIGIVFVGSAWFFVKQVRRYYLIRKSMKEA